MQISSSSTMQSSMSLQALKSLFQAGDTSSTGQEMPQAMGGPGKGGRPSGPPPGPPPSGAASQRFGGDTLSTLLGEQTETPESRMVSDLMSSFDSDGDSSLSLDEIGAAFGASDTSALAETFASLDSDGDSLLSADELSTAFEANRPERPSGPPPGRGPSSAEIASSLIESLDAGEDGGLSLDEITTALGETEEADSASLSERFAALDTDGDASLSAQELSTAFDALMQSRMQAYSAYAAATASAGVAITA